MSDEKDSWARATFKPTGAHGWLQWKGTRACIDLHCECGVHGHLDSDFLYYVKCGKCGRAYEINGHVELIPITKEEAAKAYSVHVFEGEEETE